MNLYDLTNDFLQLQQMMEDPEIDSQLLEDTMEAIEGGFAYKLDQYARVIRNMESNLDGIKKEQERLQNKRNVMEGGIKRMKDAIQSSMEAIGSTNFKSDLFNFSIQKNGGKTPIVLDVKDTSELPDELVKIKEEADLEAIRKLLENDPEAGAKYAHFGEKGKHLRIR
jgi:hypothetical protein